MKVIIDIPDNAYELLKNKQVLDNIAESIIANGTPLPKGHGRLIDVDTLDITEIKTDDYSGNEELNVVLKEDIDNAPTIIEADKEAEND